MLSQSTAGSPKRPRLFVALRALSLLAAAVAAAYVFWPRATASNAAKPAAQSPPPGASVSVRVQVPASMRTAPFDTDRYLNVPPNFSISVYARVPNARFMAVAPNGDLLVSRPGAGEVKLVRPGATGGDPTVSTFVSNLRNPHDIVFHTIGGTTYVYIAESNQINRYVYNYGDTTAQGRQIIITGLPDSSSPELQGAHGHQLKNIAVDANHKLYVSSASATNASPSDVTSNPPRASILQYDADGTNMRVFARGLRNAEGLAMLPGTNELWVVVNSRDNIAYPFHNDWDGDGSDDYGKVMQSYVDDHPPDEFTRVRDGGNYGWPYVNPNPDTPNGMDDMPFDLDVQNNANGQHGGVDAFDRITKGIQAHAAPLGLSFLQGTNFPALYRDGAVTGLHGSWNRAVKTGYKIAYFPWNNVTQTPGAEIDLVNGWLTGGGSVWGRPVDAVVDLQGSLLISDDHSGTIYKLTYSAAPTPTPTPTPNPNWAFCANENQFCSFTGTRQVRYGANGVYTYGTFTNGVNCTNAVFGDPVAGVVKSCDYSTQTVQPTPTPTPTPGGWAFCANENQFCSFTGTRQVRYGADGTYTYGTFTNGTDCTNAVFGDPLVGVYKSCAYSTEPPPPTWTPCATEGQRCQFTGTRQVRYGADGTYTYGTFTNGTDCTNAVFGDPLVGVVKSCAYAGP